MNSLIDAPAEVQSTGQSYHGVATPGNPENPSTPRETGQADFSQSIEEIPSGWPLTPVSGKAPQRPNWQSEPPLERGHLLSLLLNGEMHQGQWGEFLQEYTGYGLRTGKGRLAIDVDGRSAECTLIEISGGNLPQTTSWTSGKPGRYQLLYQLSPSLQGRIEAARWRGRKFITGAGENLDFRYNDRQSVLPPSWHPETGQYRWINAPSEVPVAPAPAWLEEMITSHCEALERGAEASTVRRPQQRPGAEIGVKQLWGDRPAPGRITSDDALMVRWNRFAITSQGQTNDVLLEFTRLLRDAGLSCAEGIEAHQTFTPQIPGYQRFASQASRKDPTWSERQVSNWWKKANLITIPRLNPSDLNQVRHESAVRRILEAVAEGLNRGLETVREVIAQIQEFTFERFGIKVARRTLYKPEILKLWHPDYCLGEREVEGTVEGALEGKTVELQEGVEHLDISRVSGRSTPPLPEPRLALLPALAWANSALETQAQLDQPPAPPATPEPFKKGDRVVIDDATGLPYCGKVATITAIAESCGIPVYRLDVDYQGRSLKPRQRRNALEALGSFLQPAPAETPLEASPPAPALEAVELTQDEIRALPIPKTHWLQALGGAAAHRITKGEVGAAIWQILTGGEAHA